MATTLDTKLSRAALQARIDALPRVRLAHLPTPLEHCPRLSARRSAGSTCGSSATT